MKYPYLDKIQKNGDVKKLPQQELPLLCEDIRNFLIESVSSTGGHLSSNLGVVELTVALHRALTLPQDKILFDVGHQCYTHKLLTGRREGFAHLRQVDGLSGFPSPQESDCDTFIAGHGSTALSTAIGVARAKKLKKEPGKVVAIIGDGAFTGGMVYEGMNNVSNLNNLIVVLNDNKMSISKNVGQMANYLTKLRTDPKYFRVKAHMETALGCIPAVGTALVEVLQEGKKIIRRGIYHSTMFEEMGFQYVGPVDGHDVTELTRIFTNLQEQYSPVFLHIVTQKGKGLKPAEENPGEFHSVSAFDLDHLTNPEMSPKDSFSNRFGNKLAALGREVPNLCAITAAMKYGTGLNFFYRAIPERFFDVGMAEEHAVTFAAGLASQGMLPVVAIYSTFFQRAYDQMIHDVNLMHLDVLFAVDRAGLVPGDGETHQGIYDTGYFSQIGIPVYSPCNYAELETGWKHWSKPCAAPAPSVMPAEKKSRLWRPLDAPANPMICCAVRTRPIPFLSVMALKPRRFLPRRNCCATREWQRTAVSWCRFIPCRMVSAASFPTIKPSCLQRNLWQRVVLASSFALPCRQQVGRAALSCAG